jgi:hypothetical protein
MSGGGGKDKVVAGIMLNGNGVNNVVTMITADVENVKEHEDCMHYTAVGDGQWLVVIRRAHILQRMSKYIAESTSTIVIRRCVHGKKLSFANYRSLMHRETSKCECERRM